MEMEQSEGDLSDTAYHRRIHPQDEGSCLHMLSQEHTKNIRSQIAGQSSVTI